MAWPAPAPVRVPSFLGARLDRRAHSVAPFGPAAVVIAHAIVAEEIGQHEPCVRGPLADAAVGHDVVGFLEPLLLLVDRAQRTGVLEGSVGIRRSGPGHAL